MLSYSIWKSYSHLLLMLLAFRQLNAECNVCAVVTNQACVADNQFQVCNNGIPSGNIYTCNGEQKCSIQGTCELSTTTNVVEVGCDTCKKCDATNTFACTGTKTFALCLGGSLPTDVQGTCSGDNICDINNNLICGLLTDGNRPACSYTDDPPTVAPTTTTPSPITQPNEFCYTLQQEGRFPVGTILNTTCKQYIHCYKTAAGGWIGAIYLCPGETYFDSSTRVCNKSVPARCSGTVRSLSLNRNKFDWVG